MVTKRIIQPIVLLLAILLTIWLMSGGAVFALDRVIDQSGVFTAAQAGKLAAAAADLGAKYGMDIVIVTTDDTGGKTARAYADDFFDERGYGVGAGRDGILFLIDFDNREAYISTSGSGIRYLTDARIESILDDVFAKGMNNKDYYGAANAFLTSTANWLAAGIPAGQYNEPESSANRLTFLDGILGLLAGGALGIGFFSGVRSQYKGRPQRAVFEYQKNSLVSLAPFADNQINAFITTRRIPRPPPGSGMSGGRSTTHRSSGGGMHGGGGRRF